MHNRGCTCASILPPKAASAHGIIGWLLCQGGGSECQTDQTPRTPEGQGFCAARWLHEDRLGAARRHLTQLLTYSIPVAWMLPGDTCCASAAALETLHVQPKSDKMGSWQISIYTNTQKIETPKFSGFDTGTQGGGRKKKFRHHPSKL